MNQFGNNNNYSLLNEEKKAQIMKDLRKEIDKHKAQYSMNNDQINDIYTNNNYSISNINNSNFKNDNYMNKEPKYTYECNDEIYNNELVKSDTNKRNESEDDEEEHLQILNNAKNVLNQIQDDINKFSEAYGMQNILQNNENISRNNNPISEHHSNYHNYIFNNNNNDSDNENSNSNNNKNIYIDNNGNNDNNNNDDYNNNYYNHYVNENEENNNYNEDEENNYENEEEYYHDNNDENNLNEINAQNYDDNDDNDNDNEEENYVNNLNNKNSSIKFKFNDNKDKINTLYQHDNNFYNSNVIHEEKENIEDDNYQHYLDEDEDDEEQQEKNNYLNDFTDNINMTNIINNNNSAIPAHNSSQNKYNFENPLNYDKENMKNNFKKYSNYSTYINQKNKLVDEVDNENIPMQDNRRKKTKSSSKPRMRLQNNIDNNEYMNKISKTNNPKYKKNKNRLLNVSNDNIFSIKNKEKFENMKKDLENKFAKEHPFKPKINKKYNEIKKNDETEEERLNRLSRPKILDINEKKRKKDLEELKKIYENNKVKPTYKVDPKEVSNRLYNNHQKMKIKKDRIKQNYEESQNKEYSFAPEINNYSKILMDKYQKKPIYERNEEFEKQKIDNIIRMRQEIEKEQKERCKPLINDKSRKLAEQNRNNRNDEEYEDVYERLYKENINKDTKSLGNRDMKECTFAPKLNPMSNYLLNDVDDYENGNEDCNENMKDFLERQKMYENLKKEKLEKKIIKNKNNYTFKPEINSNSDLLVKCNPDRYGEKLNDKYSRLYEDAQRIKIKKEKLENELNNKYDFVPKINELSKYIGRKPGIEELNYIQENKINNKMNKKEEEYDFKPQMYNNNKYKNIKSNYKNDNNMLERINEEVQNKNKKIKMMQKIKENKDIEQCNFTPEINKNVPDFENNKPMYMKGMARYLGQMEKARQAKRDKEQREKEVFLTGEGWNKNNGITVPKPFKLSYQNNQKSEMMKKELEKEEQKECYFKPKTNESKNREIIKKLLNEN